ncbi:MAG: YncE family protein [Nitrospiraceae bacterium]|nr:MAG: YncE family protein [Nitrospiraceae bacterium]
MKKNIQTFFICIVILHGFIPGCSTVGEQNDSLFGAKGQLSLFLAGPAEVFHDISFRVTAVNIISENGVSIPITTGPRDISSLSISNGHSNLAESPLPVGTYTKLVFMINNASIRSDGKVVQLTVTDESMTIPVNVMVKRQQNTSLFVYWNPDESVTDDSIFRPVMTEQKKKQELSSALIYVTNELSDNVSVINRYSGEIVDTIMVGRQPKGIAASLSINRPRLFVANSGSDSITVIDPANNSVENEIPVRYGTEPVDVTVADISSEKKLLFVANYRSNSISVIDLATYNEMEKIDVGSGPVALAADPPADSLTVSRYLSVNDINELRSYREKFINVYVVNQNSNNVSILRIDIISGRSTGVITLDVDWDPRDLYVDYIRGKVFVANYGSDKLSVINILKTLTSSSTEAVTSINNVGNHITAITSDPDFDRIYLLRDSPPEIVTIRPSSNENIQLQSMISPVLGRISVGTTPRSLTLDNEKRKIFAVNRGSDDIYVIDKTTRRTELKIPVGKRPYDIAVLPE